MRSSYIINIFQLLNMLSNIDKQLHKIVGLFFSD
jgi:hypothetical protein